MPLLVDRIPIGVVAFYFTAPVNFDDEYRQLFIERVNAYLDGASPRIYGRLGFERVGTACIAEPL